MKKFVVTLFSGTLVLALAIQSASAMVGFNAKFKELYIKEGDDVTDEEKALREAYETVKCNTCHGKDDQGKDQKKVRNAYGKALDELLAKEDAPKASDDEETKKAKNEKIIMALQEVEAMKINEEDEDSPTYGDVIKSGHLPGGDPE